MGKAQLKVLSILIAITFITGQIQPGFALESNAIQDNLAVPSMMSADLVGIQHKDIGRIKLALEAQMKELLKKEGASVDYETLKTVLEKRATKALSQRLLESKIYQPGDLQLFFNEVTPVKEGISVMSRIKDKNGIRTYYAVVSLEADKDKGFPIKGIFTEKEYEGSNKLSAELPQRRPDDEKAIDRYIQQEKGIDEVIRYAHEKGLAKKPLEAIFNYKEEVLEMLAALNIDVTTPDGLKPIENREFFLVGITPEIKQKLFSATVEMLGEEFLVIAHSSNNAVHIFIHPDFFNVMTSSPKEFGSAPGLILLRGAHGDLYNFADKEKTIKEAIYDIKIMLSHEIGAMLGLPVSRTGKDPEFYYRKEPFYPYFVNSVSKRYHKVIAGANPGDRLEFTVVDLDKNLLTRDYAAGNQTLTRGIDGEIQEQIFQIKNILLRSGALDPTRETEAMVIAKLLLVYGHKPEEQIRRLEGIATAVGETSESARRTAYDALFKYKARWGKQRFSEQADIVRTKPGKSPEDALKVIASSVHLQKLLLDKKHFTLKDYLVGYEEVREKLGFEPLADNPKSTARRDLDALVKSGELTLDKSDKQHKYALSEKTAAQTRDYTAGEKKKTPAEYMAEKLRENAPKYFSMSLRDLEDHLRGADTPIQIRTSGWLGAGTSLSGKLQKQALLAAVIKKEFGLETGNKVRLTTSRGAVMEGIYVGVTREGIRLARFDEITEYDYKNLRKLEKIEKKAKEDKTEPGKSPEKEKSELMAKRFREEVPRYLSTSLRDLEDHLRGASLPPQTPTPRWLGAGTSISGRLQKQVLLAAVIKKNFALETGDKIRLTTIRGAVTEGFYLGVDERGILLTRSGKKVITYNYKDLEKLEKIERKTKKPTTKPGKSPEDALKVIALSNHLTDILLLTQQGFTLKDYLTGYKEVYEKLGFEPLAKNSESTARRDLDALVNQGLLTVDKSGKENKHGLTNEGLSKVLALHKEDVGEKYLSRSPEEVTALKKEYEL
ncbi:MAG: hypothetical protein ABID83_05475, partial [Candidatus Omnitrophota bacterium]